MKSFVAYPLEFETLLFPPKSESKRPEKSIPHYELFKKISHLDGYIVKCGVTADEGFRRFATFRSLIGNKQEQRMIAFQKLQPAFEELVGEAGNVVLQLKKDGGCSGSSTPYQELVNQGALEHVEFIPGDVAEAIPNYLIENPELKLALLNVDLDDYEPTITTLEFLYPRLMPGGILILDNFYKYLGEYKAVKDYFSPTKVLINNFSVNTGPHYIVKP